MAKILIIEDDDFIRNLIHKILTSEGFDVIDSDNGKIGLQEVKNKQPDLVLLDLLLPEIDGFEVLKQIRNSETTKDLPVIILSNLGKEEDIEQGQELGATNYLIKSNFSKAEILASVNNCLSKDS